MNFGHILTSSDTHSLEKYIKSKVGDKSKIEFTSIIFVECEKTPSSRQSELELIKTFPELNFDFIDLDEGYYEN